jgi:FlaA1/EpsC-like NDP-sugar epimerase
MAKDLIAMHGLRPDIDVKIEFSGLRPGEKLHEDLITEKEQVKSSPNESILVSQSDFSGDLNLDDILGELKKLTEQGDGDEIRKLLNRVIPDAHLEEH